MNFKSFNGVGITIVRIFRALVMRCLRGPSREEATPHLQHQSRNTECRSCARNALPSDQSSVLSDLLKCPSFVHRKTTSHGRLRPLRSSFPGFGHAGEDARGTIRELRTLLQERDVLCPVHAFNVHLVTCSLCCCVSLPAVAATT